MLIINNIFILHTKYTQRSLQKIEMQKLPLIFVWIWCPNTKKPWSLYNIKQHYPESICLKQQRLRQRIGMFKKARKANIVVIKTRTIIATLKCYVFQCFSNIIYSKTLHVFWTSYSKPNFILLCDNGQFSIFTKMGQKQSY